MKKKIAIIGGGTGLTLAWLLSGDFDVTLFEKEARLGGHIETLKFDDDKVLEAGTEFINPNYKYFFKLMNFLEIQLRPFLLSLKFTGSEPSDSALFTLNPLDKIKNLIEEQNLKIEDFTVPVELLEVIALYKKETNRNLTLEDWVKKINKEKFANEKLYSITAASWGVTVEESKKFLIKYAMNYLDAGCLLFEVIGGLSTYIDRLEKITECKKQLNYEVNRIEIGSEGKYTIVSDKNPDNYEGFDHVIVCTCAEITVKLIDGLPLTGDLLSTLRKLKYYNTKIIFEEASEDDTAVVNIKNDKLTISKKWNSNIVKRWVNFDENYENALETITYRHPYMGIEFSNVQDAFKNHNKDVGGLLFGSILGGDDDSHESGLRTSVDLARKLYTRYGIEKPEKLKLFDDKFFFCC